MRTTIDLPDAVFRETKSLAAMRGVSLKQFILEAIEQAKRNPPPPPVKGARKFPSFHLRSRRTLSLKDFDFDDLLT
jgi:hypothetical protein